MHMQGERRPEGRSQDSQVSFFVERYLRHL